MDANDVDAALRRYEQKLFGDAPLSTPESILARFRDVVRSSTDESDITEHTMRNVASLLDAVDAGRKNDTSNRVWLELMERVVRLKTVIQYMRQANEFLTRLGDHCVNPNTRKLSDIMSESLIAEMSSSSGDCEEMSKYQRFLSFLLMTANERGYAKCGSMLYERVRDRRSNRLTCAWKAVGSIDQFVYSVTDRDTRFDQWLNMTSNASNAPNAIQYLERCQDRLLPVLVKDRHLFGFADGLYVSRTDTFYHHDRIPAEYSNKGTAKFFDCDFPGTGSSCFDIATPYMSSIFEYQEFPEDVVFFAMALMGRLLYEVGSMDNWQVMPFFMGRAQSGKSTLLIHVCSGFFDAPDVGVLSNNSEKTFGLSGFVDKFIFVAPEVNEYMKLDQAEFQSVVAGDMMQIAQKHVTSKTIVWKVPGILAGNQVPGWKDTAGSILRRIVMLRFRKTVAEVDTKLPERLREELPLCLIKCNRAYLECLQRVGNSTLHEKLPAYFKNTQKELHEQINPLQAFLNSGYLCLGSNLYMPWSDFVKRFKAFCDESGLPTTALGKKQEDTYKSTLETVYCFKTPRDKRRYPRWSDFDELTTTWLHGADDVNECR